MHSILVINPKGGCGKSTLAMNLAGFFACWGVRVALVDLDQQGSCLDWIAARPATRPLIEARRSIKHASQDHDIEYQIVDVPSSCFDNDMRRIFSDADTVIIPLLPSINDFRATGKFLSEVEEIRRSLSNRTDIGFIANRVRNNTRSFELLKEFISATDIPCRGVLRETQNYIRVAESGLSLFEMPSHRVARDLLQWRRVIKWLCFDQHISCNIPCQGDVVAQSGSVYL